MSDKKEIKKPVKFVVYEDTLLAILNTVQDGEEPTVQYSKDPTVFAQRAAALSMKKCGQAARMIQSILLGENVALPEPDTIDGKPIVEVDWPAN